MGPGDGESREGFEVRLSLLPRADFLPSKLLALVIAGEASSPDNDLIGAFGIVFCRG
jgi:hypothetical protein